MIGLRWILVMVVALFGYVCGRVHQCMRDRQDGRFRASVRVDDFIDVAIFVLYALVVCGITYLILTAPGAGR